MSLKRFFSTRKIVFDKYHDFYVSSYNSFIEKNNKLNHQTRKEDKEEIKLTHVNENGKASMVDVSHKDETERSASATASIYIGAEAFKLVSENSIKKGDVLSVAQLAGIMGAKKTSDLIPLCHPLRLTSIKVFVHLNQTTKKSVTIECRVKCNEKTGVEMEALTGVSIAALTVYDMCKAVNKEMIISDIKLTSKTGGKSDYFI